MTNRVKYTDTGTTTTTGFTPVYNVTYDGRPLGQVWKVSAKGPWAATAAAVRADGLRGEGPNRGRAVAAVLVKAYGLPWSVAFDAAGVKR